MSRVHVLGIAHTQLTKAFSSCAYTQKVIGFAEMMKNAGNKVIVYASEDNDAPCDELVTCITKEEQKEFCGVEGPDDILKAPFDRDAPHWKIFTQRCIEAAKERVQDGDILAMIQGWMQQSVVDAVPQAISVEFGIGYQGITLRDDVYRAFESEAWRAQVIGKFYGAHGVQGRFQDRVIPGYIRLDDFPFVRKPLGSYALYMGRMNEDKGVMIAAEACKAAGFPLVTAGLGSCIPDLTMHRGNVGPEERAELMGNAIALFAPSIYMEPFGNVVIEAQACGTPAITTNFGAFPETNPDGVGFRCNTMADFVNALKNFWTIDRDACRAHAEQYSLEATTPKYEQWFADLAAGRNRSWMEI